MRQIILCNYCDQDADVWHYGSEYRTFNTTTKTWTWQRMIDWSSCWTHVTNRTDDAQ